MRIAEIREYLDYCPKTGAFTWLQCSATHTEIGSHAGGDHGNGYIAISVKGNRFYAHRLACAFMNGHWPDQVDHINGKRDDNRWDNLRDVSHLENHRNQKLRKNNLSGVMGVSWSKREMRWRAYINDQGKQVSLGRFKRKCDAVHARKSAERSLGFHEGHGK